MIEQNRKLILNSMAVKYPQSVSGANTMNINGKGIVESTSIHFLRLYLTNRLDNRKGFIKASLRVLLMKEFNS